MAFRHPCLKNFFLSQYLFIAILCVKMSRVNKALANIYLVTVVGGGHFDIDSIGALIFVSFSFLGIIIIIIIIIIYNI